VSYLAAGRALEALGNFEQALDQYFMAMLDPPSTPELELRMIGLLERLDRRDEARELAAKLPARGVDLAGSWFDLGVAYKGQGQLAEAIYAVAQCVRLEPNQGDGWYNLACYRCLAGDAAGSLEALGFAIQLASENAKVAVEDADLASIGSDAKFLAITA